MYIQKLRATGFGNSLREAAEIVEEELRNPEPYEVVIQNKFVGVNGLFDRAIVRNEVPYRFLKPPITLTKSSGRNGIAKDKVFYLRTNRHYYPKCLNTKVNRGF